MRLPPANHTLHADFENCPRKAYHVRLAKDLPKSEPSEAMLWGRKVHDALEARINRGTPLPPNLPLEDLVQFGNYQARAELKVAIRENGKECEFFDSDVWARGVVDVVLNAKPDLGTVMFLDWKTGKPREEPAELEFHAVLYKAKEPQLEKIVGSYVWLQQKKIGKLHDLSETDKKLEAIRRTHDDIGHRLAMGEQAFPPRQNPLCGWCPVKQCEFNHTDDHVNRPDSGRRGGWAARK